VTARSDFSDVEWGTVIAGLVAPGVGVMILDPGVVSTFKELKAIVDTLLAAPERYPGIERLASVGARSTTVKQEAINPNVPVEEQLGKTLETLRGALRLVDARATPAEAQAYRKLCLEVAHASAGASGNGVFGIGAKVSFKEKEYIRQVEATLG
jgi:hypothetical protein